jgi:Uma2 family endonuclease
MITRNPDTVRAPDVAFIGRKKVEQVGNTSGYWPGAPDLAVEVVSPSDTYEAVMETAMEWLEAGAAMVLVLNPRQATVTVYRSLHDIAILNTDAVLDLHDVVPEFKVTVKELFT